MIKKPADVLPSWTIEDASAGKYVAGNVVWYKSSEDGAGYAYKAKAPYTETRESPDTNESNWYIDYTYAPPWSPNGKYIIGARVYYFNGVRAYVYVASVRYFGGSDKPNEEVDLDGVRTWELEQEYDLLDSDGTGTFKVPRDCEFLFPIKKIAGFTGNVSKNSSSLPTDPEERPYIYIFEEGSPTIREYIKNNELFGKEDYSDLNSVYQSHTYDTNVYQFYSSKLDSDGNLIHERKGIHKAEFIKLYDEYADKKYRKNGKSQFAYISHAQATFGQYYNPYGFAIEMWPHANESDYELVPSASLHNIYEFDKPWTYYIRSQRPPYYLVHSSSYGSVTYGFGDSVYMHGEYSPPDGAIGPEATPATPEIDAIKDAFFYTTTPAFSTRISRIYFIKIDRQGSWKENPVYGPDPDNPESLELIIIGYYYTLEFGEPTISLISEQVDSFDVSYKDDNLLDFSRTLAGTNQINFNKYKRPMVETEIYNCGWKVD